jgi:hypothetical protein
VIFNHTLDYKQEEDVEPGLRVDDRFDILIGRHHQRLFRESLNENHFDRLTEHLVITLETCTVPRPVIDEVFVALHWGL